jgi:hypothetical protein
MAFNWNRNKFLLFDDSITLQIYIPSRCQVRSQLAGDTEMLRQRFFAEEHRRLFAGHYSSIDRKTFVELRKKVVGHRKTVVGRRRICEELVSYLACAIKII